MITSRRSFLGLLAAPAIVRASSLMKVVPLPELRIGEWPGVAIKGWGEFAWGTQNWGGIPIAQLEGAAELARNYARAEDELLGAALR